MDIQSKRVYEPFENDDGARILVDRVWPRGVSKKTIKADLWLKDAAPSSELRKWFNHDRNKWNEFKQRYFSELDTQPHLRKRISELAEGGRVTLLFSARDTQYNQAVALKEYLDAGDDSASPD